MYERYVFFSCYLRLDAGGARLFFPLLGEILYYCLGLGTSGTGLLGLIVARLVFPFVFIKTLFLSFWIWTSRVSCGSILC